MADKIGLNFRTVIVILLILLVAIFALQNAEMIRLRLFFWEVEMSRAMMVLTLLLLGIVAGWLLRGHFRKSAR